MRHYDLSREHDACGIGFLASRTGVAERDLVDKAIELTQHFDHRGAAGHGAGFQIDIPWALMHRRFRAHAQDIAQRDDVAIGMFFLPYDSGLRARCVDTIESLSAAAGAPLLQWEDVPIDPSALPAGSGALRTLPVVRQALFRRPKGMGRDAWFACRFMLRLALDHELTQFAGDQFAVVSLSNKTIVYKGLADLSRIADLYPDLRDEDVVSRYVLFHSRYCTNTTTAWRRAQPFWSIAHNGEISTIAGNAAWMTAVGGDLLQSLVERFPDLAGIAKHVGPIVAEGGSDTSNLDDMVIALVAGGASLPQALLALLPIANSQVGAQSALMDFNRSAAVYLGACDGPAAIVACDGQTAVAHLDRNGLRPLWNVTTDRYVMAVSELTGQVDLGHVLTQNVMGPGETLAVRLDTGEVMHDDAVHQMVTRKPFPQPFSRLVEGLSLPVHASVDDLIAKQVAFGMTKEDIEVLVGPMAATGKPSLGSMGDDTPPAAMLDVLPRRLEDHFALRFAQETNPPIDPVRDAWVFDSSLYLGDRRGLWSAGRQPIYHFEDRILSNGQLAWLHAQSGVLTVDITIAGVDIEAGIDAVVDGIAGSIENVSVIVFSDRNVGPTRVALPPMRIAARVHDRLVELRMRNRVGLVADVGVWDIHHCAMLIALGVDAVCPWLGCASALDGEKKYLKAVRAGFVEVMSMMGVTPASAYCGARLIEAIALDREFVAKEFPGVPCHLSGIGVDEINRDWLAFHAEAFGSDPALVDAGEFRHAKNGRPHANNAEIVRSLHAASGYAKKIHGAAPGSREAYDVYAGLVRDRAPITILDGLTLAPGRAIPIEEVESETEILWRFMAPGMSEGALSEPAHRSIARAFNVLHRYCRLALKAEGKAVPASIGPVANSGEGGFDKSRMGRRDGNRSIQYAGGRFTITPMTAALADEAEIKFAQGAKPGKGGQLPGRKVSPAVAQRRGCNPWFELVSPPVNHNLYSIEDVKLILESWRVLNPKVNCSLKFVATHGVELVCVGGVNAGANRLHLSDGCGGTGAAKRVDQKHAGCPVAAVLPKVHDMLIEEGVRGLVELSVDGGVQTGEQALKLFLLGADRVGFGTSLLISIGCSMLRKCHLSGPDPADPTGRRRLGCTPGVATQDPELIARFTGDHRHIVRMLRFVAQEIREKMAALGIRSIADVVGRRDLLAARTDLTGKAAKLDLGGLVRAPHSAGTRRDYEEQARRFKPTIDAEELEAVEVAMRGECVKVTRELSNRDRCVGVAAAGVIARRFGDPGLPCPKLKFFHTGAAGHFYAAYCVSGLRFDLRGAMADSCFAGAYGGVLIVADAEGRAGMSLVGNAFGYGARGGAAFIAGRAGNRFGICLRQSHEGDGVTFVVEGVAANAFQYMTGGTAVVLGSTGPNLGSGMTGGVVYLLDAHQDCLNDEYVIASQLDDDDATIVNSLIQRHHAATGSTIARDLLDAFDRRRFTKVTTRLVPDPPIFAAAEKSSVAD